MISSAPHCDFATTRATTIAPASGSVMTSACACFTFGNDSRQPSTSPSATRLPSTFTPSSSRPARYKRPLLSSLPLSPVRNQPCLSTEPIDAGPLLDDFDVDLPFEPLVSASYGPSETGDSAFDRTHRMPSLFDT